MKAERAKSLLTSGAELINFAPLKLESECRVYEEGFGRWIFYPFIWAKDERFWMVFRVFRHPLLIEN
jgi:hypothetical protein